MSSFFLNRILDFQWGSLGSLPLHGGTRPSLDERQITCLIKWGPNQLRVIWRFLMFSDILCGDSTGNIP